MKLIANFDVPQMFVISLTPLIVIPDEYDTINTAIVQTIFVTMRSFHRTRR